MNPTIQPGMHPDAESLTAFVEQLLPAAQREEILAHMSACSRCRKVVFLAQQAEEDQLTPVTAASKASGKPRHSWLNWRWAWIPIAACAGLIGFGVVHHYRGVPTETQTAVNVTPRDSFQTEEPPKDEIQKPAPQNEPKPANPAKSSGMVAEREAAPEMSARDDAKTLDKKTSADQKDQALDAGAPPVALAPGVAGGSMHGMMEARAKSSSIGGPSAANQFQQQNAANQQNILQQSQNAPVDATNKTVNAPTTPRAESETLTIQAPNVVPTQAAATPAAAQVNAIPTTKQNKTVSLADAPEISKEQKASLPNGLESLSAASNAGRTIALDTKGTLFVSEDGGKHWKPVRIQWTGRAVLVRAKTTAEKGSALGGQGALKISPTPKFELVTDNLQTWVSTDGNTWTLQAMPGK